MPDQPTPEDIAAYEAVAGPAPVNPIRDLSAEDLAALAVQDKTFNIPEAFRSQPDLHGDQAIVQKAADALNLVKQRGFSLKDLPTVGEAGATVWGASKGFGKQLWNYANIAGNVVAGSVAEMTGQSGLARGYGENIDARLAQNIAGTEEAMTGLAQLAEKGVGKVGRAIGAMKSYADYTPGEKVADLFADVGRAETSQQRLSGAGVFTSAVTGGTGAETLKRAGVTPEQVGELAAGDPFSFFLFGKGAALAGKAAGAVLPASVKAIPAVVEAAASKALPAIGGGLVEAAGKTAEIGAKGVTTAGKVASVAGPIVGGLSALAGGDITTAGIGGLASGAGGAALKRLGQLAAEQAPKITRLGEQIAGKAPVASATAQLGRDFLQALPGAAGEVAKGAALDLGLAAATAETPQETQGAAGFGTVLGALGGTARIGGHVLSGQLIGPRAYGSGKPVPSSGNFPAFDSMHSDAMKSAAPGVQTRLNAIREFLNGAAPGTDVFFGKDAATVESALKQAGVSDATAKLWAAQEGFFTADLPGGRVVVLRNVDAAPHEAFHPIQDVIGEEANRAIDRVVFDVYGDRWDTEGEKYASRLGKRPDASWQETVLDASGWGLTEAKEKLYRDIYNRVVGETGAEPAPGVVAEMAKAALGKVMDEAVTRNPQIEPNEVARHAWREILSPEEAQQVADRYIAREIAGENFDALFKHSGPALMATGVSQRLADIVGNLLSAVGIEPLAGRTSEFGQVPLSTPVIEAVRKAATGERPTVEPAAAPALPKVAAPVAPVQKQSETAPEADAQNAARPEAAEARAIADAAPELPQIGGTKSPRELLGVIAESIAKNEGVKINYLSAPDEPAAATTSNRDVRRAIIEAFRDRPELRQLWEKTFFPEKVIQTKSGKYQIQGWAPEVFAANAHKMAKFLSEVPEAELLSPFKIDSATKTFTVEEWKRLYEVTQQFVKNQMVGYTGAGEPLVVPRSVTEAGGYAPPVKPGAKPIPQAEADFINLLFNFRLPDSPRIVTGRRPLNIQAQDVSVATKPGRIRVPVEPREKFSGAEAERQNIAGREILETNPLRNQLEQAASKAGVGLPSMIEAIQKLNLENIKEVAGTPEQPQFRGNTLTLSAGFQPEISQPSRSQEREWRITGQLRGVTQEITVPAADMAAARKQAQSQGMRVSKIEAADKFTNAMFQPEISQPLKSQEREWRITGQLRGVTQEITVPAADMAAARKQAQSQGMRVSKIEAADKFTNAMFQPKPLETAGQVEKFTPEEFRAWAATQPQGFTRAAWDVGIAAPDRAFVDSLKARADSFGDRVEYSRANLRNGDVANIVQRLDDLTALASQGQFFTEAYEAATGTGSGGERLRKENPNYEPAFPAKEDRGESPVQFAPRKQGEETQEQYLRRKRKIEKSPIPETFWLRPDGTMARGEGWMMHGEVAKEEWFRLSEKNPQLGGGGDAWGTLEKLGYLHGMREGKNNDRRFWISAKREPTKAQKKAIEDMAFATGLEPVSEKKFGVIKPFFGEPLFPESMPEDISGQAQPKPAKEVQDLAEKYARSAGIPYVGGERKYAAAPETLLKNAADFYQAAKDAPDDPAVVASYDALKQETADQYQAMVDAGYTIEPWLDSGQPYSDSAAMVADVRDNKHLYYFQTESGYGKPGDAVGSKNLMLEPSGVTLDDVAVPFNDLFRAVHDFFGHAKEGYQFGPRGEFNAWGTHSEMYSEAAQGALAAETLAQNAFVNFGPHMRSEGGAIRKAGEPGYLGVADRPFAEQKNVVVPRDLIDQARAQFSPRESGGNTAITESGKDLERRGFRIEHLGKGTSPEVRLFVDGAQIGEISAVINRKNRATIDHVGIDPAYRGNLFSETLYREMGKRLQDMGIKTVDGFIVDERALAGREKVFPRTKILKEIPIGESSLGYEVSSPLESAQFAPKKKGDEFKFQPPKSGFSKAWVLPDGTPVQLGGTWHHQWLAENQKVAEKYGLNIPSFEGTDTEGVRESALKAGFGRVNYAQNSGTLTVEARARDWRKIKPAIERMVESNLDDIDNMSVTLLDEKAAKTVDSGFARLFNYDGPEKLQHLPFISEGEVRGQFQPEQADLIDVPRDSQRSLSKEIKTLKEKYPEALALQYRTNDDGTFRIDAKGKPTPVGVPYGLYDTPLAKSAVKGKRGDEAKEAAIVDAYADKIKSAYREAKKNPAIAAGANWYSLAREKLQKFFGPDTKFFTELLGATSAQTDVPTNFKYSIDAYNNFKAGKYDDVIRKYQEGKEIWETGDLGLEPGEKSLADWMTEAGLEKDATRAAWMRWWIDKHDLKPRQSNGKLFGSNSDAVLKVLDGSWRESVQGPKTPNFAGNLSGDSFEATIDIWSARGLHRMGNEGNSKRWRLLPKNETGVTDPDFFLGQKAYRSAADDIGISPDSLQAILWFYEKDLWDSNGWTKGAGKEKSDFNVLLDRTTRASAGGKLRILPEDVVKPTYTNEKQQLDFGLE